MWVSNLTAFLRCVVQSTSDQASLCGTEAAPLQRRQLQNAEGGEGCAKDCG